MTAALGELKGLHYSTQLVSLYESYLTAKWFEANGRYPDPEINDANEAVNALFVFDPTNPIGRLGPFRWDWRTIDASGRKTVWNNTTRGPKVATKIFNGDDIRQGLVNNAADIVGAELDGRPLPSRQALACLVLRDYEFSPSDDWTVAESALMRTLSMSAGDLAGIASVTSLGQPLLSNTEWSVADLPEPLAPPTMTTLTPPSAVANQASDGAIEETVSIDSRVERMLRRGISRFPCVLLVGPPGSGKGMLVRWLVDKVKSNPTEFGFSAGLDPAPMWRTPDESWSSFELIGGLAPDRKGELRWAHGILVASMREHRWLVLDETNRADMDKIMGPLLTWLSVQQVEIGRTKGHDGDPIEIGWSSNPTSEAITADGLEEPTVFLAGRDWRLIGTYNPQDAQRVFRFGQALSRRFVTVPIPAIQVGQFELVLAQRFPAMAEPVAAAVAGLYSAHRASESTTLGPAVFLRLADYIAGADGVVEELTAEAYVLSIGKYLSAYDDHIFAALGARVVTEEEVLGDEQWAWVEEQRLILG